MALETPLMRTAWLLSAGLTVGLMLVLLARFVFG
jgi:hypothetical protein